MKLKQPTNPEHVVSPPRIPADAPRLAVLCLSGCLGGLELNSLKFAGWMRERGWQVTFLAPAATPLVTWATKWFVPFVTLAVRRGLAMPLAAWELKRQLERLDIRVLVVTQNKDLALATLAKVLLGGRLRVVYQQHMQLGQPKRSFVHTLRFRLVDAWLTPLPGLAREVVQLTHFDHRKLHVVPLGLPLEQFAASGRPPASARQELYLPLHGCLLGILGRFDAGKGQDFVIEVLHLLRSQHGREVGLVIMGEPTRGEGDAYYQQLRRLVTHLDLDQHVYFRGFRANPAVFFQAIDAFVLASENETYGLVTLEALAAGVPVVAAATGGTVELLRHNQTGLLYPRRDASACARAVRHTLDDPAATAQRVAHAQLERWRYSHHRQCALTEDVIWALSASVVAAPRPVARPLITSSWPQISLAK